MIKSTTVTKRKGNIGKFKIVPKKERMGKVINKQDIINNVVKIFFILSCVLFATPSIIYLIRYGTAFEFNNWFQFLLNDTDRYKQTLIYIVILGIMVILYFMIVKGRKELFKSKKGAFRIYSE